MKKLSLCLVMLISSILCFGQELKLSAKQSFPLPKSVDPYLLAGNKKHSTLNTLPAFYPIGWSQDNKFAWCQSYFLDGMGCNKFDFYIQDMIDDSIVFELHQTSEESVQSIWNQNCNEYQEALTKFGIEKCTQKLLKFPVKVKGKGRKVSVYKIVDKLGQDPDMGFDMISYRIVAEKDGKVKEIDHGFNIMQQDIFVTGCYYSTFENRIAVILANEVPGFEGTDIKYSVAGCQLRIGFE